MLKSKHLIALAAGAAMFSSGLAWAATHAPLIGQTVLRALDDKGDKDKDDDDDKKLAVADIPQKVTDAVKSAFADATITGAEKDTDDDKTKYELDLTSGGSKYEVKVADDGTILCQEETIAQKDLPQKVTDAVKTAYSAGAITEAEKETKKGKTLFEVDVTSGGKHFEMKIAPDGTVAKNKEEEKDDDD